MEKGKKIIKEILPYIIIVGIVVLVRSFIITPVLVDGSSMNPTLKDKEILLLKKYDKSYDRFDIIVFQYSQNKLIKRIIGLPGEEVEYKDNKLYINGKQVKETFETTDVTEDFKLEEIDAEVVPDNCYFVMGDNRTNSTDSRIIGFVCENQISGITDFSLFPLNKFGFIN